MICRIKIEPLYFRDLDVVGLADSPTEGAVGLSGHCAEVEVVLKNKRFEEL